MNFHLGCLATVQLYFKSVEYLYFCKGLFCPLSHFGEFAYTLFREGVGGLTDAVTDEDQNFSVSRLKYKQNHMQPITKFQSIKI